MSLIHPVDDGAPFAIALELLNPDIQEPGLAPRSVTPAYELRYVLQGAGDLIRDTAVTDTLQAGDTVLSAAGAVHCRAHRAEPGADVPWGLASLIAYVPHAVVNPGERDAAVDAAPDELALAAWGPDYEKSPQQSTVSAALAANIVSGAKAAAAQALRGSGGAAVPLHIAPPGRALQLFAAATDWFLTSIRALTGRSES